MDDVPRMVQDLSSLPEAPVTAICDHVSENCRGCMFHNDACFMNIIFMVFKSVESGRAVGPNRVRPSMRVITRL